MPSSSRGFITAGFLCPANTASHADARSSASSRFTPPAWRDAYALRRGSVFGLSHPLAQLSYLRPGRRHGPQAPGLHWVGASTRPGNGVPLVLIGAMQTAREVLEDLSEEPDED